MSTNNFYRSDLPGIYNLVQSSVIVYPKEMIIAVLKDFFSKDSYYHYSADPYGFANTPDHTDLPLGAGLRDNLTTRVFIGENFRYDGIYYPAILVKSGGGKYVPLSSTRERGTVLYDAVVYEDGYGNKKTIHNPKSFLFAGIWEGSINIDIYTRSLRARDDLCELVGICFTDIMFDTLVDAGIMVKPLTIQSPSESDDRNDKLFKQSISLEIRTEWRREVPVKTLIDHILFSFELGEIKENGEDAKPGIIINTDVSLVESLINL